MLRWLRFGASVVCLCVFALAAPASFARQGILVTKDGRTLSGDIQADPDGKNINITLHGGTLTISSDNVASITYPADADKDFHQRLAALDPDDITGRLDLCRFELNARQYDLATDAARDVQRLDPHNPDAAMLLDTIQSQRSLDSKTAAPPPSPTAPQPAAESAPAKPPGNYLTMDDVYAIRRGELRPDDSIRIQFLNHVRERYLSSQTTTSDFNSESDVQKALDILQYGDPTLAKDVRPDADPRTMLEFRRQVQPRILAGCAAAGCHNSEASGGFMLYPDARETLPAYTNYYILLHTGRKLDGGDTFGNGPVYRPMFDRLHPESSLILQFALPRSMATMPHPEVKGLKPLFTGLTDPGYLIISQWIANLAPITPQYDIKFDIPTGKPPTTQGS